VYWLLCQWLEILWSALFFVITVFRTKIDIGESWKQPSDLKLKDMDYIQNVIY
jgi:hypothetical protein